MTLRSTTDAKCAPLGGLRPPPVEPGELLTFIYSTNFWQFNRKATFVLLSCERQNTARQTARNGDCKINAELMADSDTGNQLSLGVSRTSLGRSSRQNVTKVRL